MSLQNQLPVLKDFKSDKRLRFFAYYPIFAEAFKSHLAAMIFCSLGQWQGYENDPDGSIYKTNEEMAKETGLTINRVATGKRKLQKLGIVACSYIKIPRTTHYSIKWEVVNQLLENHMTQTSINASPEIEITKPQSIENNVTIPTTATNTITTQTVNNSADDNLCLKCREINSLMNVFQKTINPTLDYHNKTQRNAAKTVINKLGGIQNALEVALYAVQIQGEKYAPVITTPLQLKYKLGQLLAFRKRQENSNNQKLIVSI